MSQVVAAAVAALNEKIDAALPGTVKFVIEGEGAVIIDAAGARADEGTVGGAAGGDGEADVTLTADADTFEGMLRGTVNPMGAYMSGRLRVEGNMGMAMQMAQILA